MSDKPIVLVAGATGSQGGSVARHLLASGKYAVRALSRNPNSDKAKALREAGAEVVAGDLDKPETLLPALKGAWGAFGVTNFWEHFGKEFEQGKALIDAVAEAKVSHFVFSTLPSVKKVSGGKIEVPHFDIKADLEQYARDKGISASFVHLAFYYENLGSFIPLQRQDDGSFTFGFSQGDTPLAGVSVEDLGAVVRAIFDNPDQYRGKVIPVAGDHIPASEYAAVLSRVLGKKVVYNYIPQEVYAKLGFPGAEEVANMFEYYRVYDPYTDADVQKAREIAPGLQTFEAWLKAHTQAFSAVTSG